MLFTDYARSLGIYLNRDDINFINKRVKRVVKSKRRAIILRYCEIWANGVALETIEHRKMTHGRRVANIWLLENT